MSLIWQCFPSNNKLELPNQCSLLIRMQMTSLHSSEFFGSFSDAWICFWNEFSLYFYYYEYSIRQTALCVSLWSGRSRRPRTDFPQRFLYSHKTGKWILIWHEYSLSSLNRVELPVNRVTSNRMIIIGDIWLCRTTGYFFNVMSRMTDASNLNIAFQLLNLKFITRGPCVQYFICDIVFI